MFWGMHGESMGATSELLVLDTEKPDFVIADHQAEYELIMKNFIRKIELINDEN